MNLRDSVRRVISGNAVTHRWFVAICARFTMRLFHFQSFLSVTDLKAKRRASRWRKVMAFLDRPGLAQVVIAGGRATFHYTDGCAFYAAPARASLSGTQYTQDDFEPGETRIMAEVVKPGWTVVDAGANFGWHTVHLSRAVGPQGKVIAFEPIPATFRELEDNLALNACANVEACPSALGPRDETITMFLPGIDNGAGAASQFLDMGVEIEVPMRALDSYLQEGGIGRVGFIKADIEGGELNLLRGASRLLARDHPAILIEIVDIHCKRFGHTPKEVIGFLADLGYAGTWIDGTGALTTYDPARPPNGNYLFRLP
jgi:FkbM family methyltransferase